jgi:ParB/RepB/Spo0J family partition protein
VRNRKKGGGYEIIAGERRWRSFGLLIDDGVRDALDGLPCIVRDVDDLTMLRMMVVENGRREGLHAIEEARGYKLLVDKGESPEAIAGLVGLSKRHIEIRLSFLHRLSAKALVAFEKGEISVAHARVLILASHKLQDMLINRHKSWDDGMSPARMKQEILNGAPRVGTELFDLALYTGTFDEDPDDTAKRYFADVALFEKLQTAAIEAKKKELRKDWAWVEVTRNFYSWNWGRSTNKAKAGAIIEVHSGLRVTIHTGLLKEEDARRERQRQARGGAKKSGSAPAKPAEPATKAHNTHVQRRKTIALQAALAGSERYAKIMICLALLGHHEDLRVYIEGTAWMDRSDLPTAPSVAATVKDLGPAKAGAYPALKAMKPAELDRLFAALVARRTHTLHGYYGDQLGDTATICALAADLGIVGHEAEHGLALQAEDLEGLRNGPLIATATAIGAPAAGTGAALRKAIVQTAPKTYVLPTLTFGGGKELLGQLMKQGKLANRAAHKAVSATPKAKKAAVKKAATAKKKPGARAGKAKR